MNAVIKESIRKQFGASIDMLENAIKQLPEDMLNNKRGFYIAYHTLVFLDYYLTVPPVNFSAVLPFTEVRREDIPAEALDDIVPNKIYTKTELLSYLQASRQKCYHLIKNMELSDDERFIETPENGGRNYPLIEMLLYNMRHVQHHAAQLNLLLRQSGTEAPDWVSRGKDI